jgi:hypothetical protein
MDSYRMQVLRPGKSVPAVPVKSVVLVDNSAIQPDEVGHEVTLNGQAYCDTVFDSEPLSGYVLSALSRYLLQNGACTESVWLNRYELRPIKFKEGEYLRSNRLSPEKYARITADTSLDVLYSLDRLLVRSVTNYDTESRVGSRDVFVSMVWRVYDLRADTLLSQFQSYDSLYWETTGSPGVRAVEQLPLWGKVLPEIGEVMAEKVAPLLGNYWETVDQSYYATGNKRLRRAAALVRADSLEKASELWEAVYANGMPWSRYWAAFNRVLYSEFKDDPIGAQLWLDRSWAAWRSCPFCWNEYDLFQLYARQEAIDARKQELLRLKK